MCSCPKGMVGGSRTRPSKMKVGGGRWNSVVSSKNLNRSVLYAMPCYVLFVCVSVSVFVSVIFSFYLSVLPQSDGPSTSPMVERRL